MKSNLFAYKILSVVLVMAISVSFVNRAQASDLFRVILVATMVAFGDFITLSIWDYNSCWLNVIWGGCGGAGAAGGGAVAVDVRVNGNPSDINSTRAGAVDWRTLTSNDVDYVSLSAPAAFMVKWSSQNTTDCTANWSGETGNAVGTAGVIYYDGVAPSMNNFTLTCSGVSDTATVEVIGPSVNLTVDPEIEIPDPLTLSWNSSNVTSCTATSSPDVWNGGKDLSGTETVLDPTRFADRGGYEFTITCSDDAGDLASDTATTTVVQVPRCSFTADPALIKPPQASTLAWICDYVSSCQLSNNQNSTTFNLPVSGGRVSGSRNVRPTTTTIYTLECQGMDGSRSWNRTVDVASSTGRIIEDAPR